MKLYYETTDMDEIDWLKLQKIEPDMLHEQDDHTVVFLFKKAPALFLSLARMYYQDHLSNEFDEIEKTFAEGQPIELTDDMTFIKKVIGND